MVDDANESGAATNGNHHSPRENGIDGKKSPGSESSSSGKKKEESGKKPSQRSTPTSKPHGNVTPLPGEKRKNGLLAPKQSCELNNVNKNPNSVLMTVFL